MHLRRSIRFTLPLLICGLVLAVLTTFTVAAYRYARRTQIAVFESRLGSAAQQLAQQLTVSTTQFRAQATELSRDRAIAALAVRPSASTRRAAVARLREVAARIPTQAAAEVRRPDLSVLLVEPDRSPRFSSAEVRALVSAVSSSAEPVVGTLGQSREGLAFPIASKIAPGGRTLGYLVEHRRFPVTPRVMSQIQGLIGLRTQLLLGTRGRSVWTDFDTPNAAPDSGWRPTPGSDAAFTWRGGAAKLAVFAPVAGTSWTVGVALPASDALAEPRRFLGEMIVLDALLFVASGLGAVWLSGYVTRPLAELVTAVDDVSRGDYSRRVAIDRQDEFGTLANAFNDMSGSLAVAFRELGMTTERLAASTDRYEMIFDASPTPKWVYDLETLRFLAVNRAAVEHYGYSREEFLAMTIADVRAAEDVPALMESVAKLGHGGRVDGEHWRHRRKDGTPIDVEVHSRQIEFDGRQARFVLAMDVTERLRTDALLRESEARFRQMAEYIQQAFFVVDLSNFVALYVSPTWAEIWGRPIEEGSDPLIWFDSIHPDDQQPVRESQQAVLRGETAGLTFRVIRPDASTRWVRSRSFPVRDEHGRVYRMVGVATDITEAKQAEEQLLQSQKMDAVGRLAGGVAHDFNNLLTVILSWSDVLLEDTPPGDPRHSLISEIKAAGERAASLTRQLLAFSRKQVLAPRVFDLNSLVRDTERFLRRLIGEDIALRAVLDPDLLTLRADPGQIEQVIMNLAINARDAMPGGGALTIETANRVVRDARDVPGRHARPGRYVTLTVSDTGTGMDAETLRHLFEPFFTTKGVGKGTGLGLATVYGIVEQSGGFISVTSELGKGSTFTLYFPIAESEPAIVEARSGPHAAPLGKETVLLVEDEEQLRSLTGTILKSRGYLVLTAENGEDALRVAAAHDGRIDLLLSDVVMPRMSGPELAQRLALTRPDMRVLFVSGYTDGASYGRGPLAADAAFVEKPFTPAGLAQRVRAVLGG